MVGVKPGDVLAGKYRVERMIGAGGMGVVVAARHAELGQRVALKFMRGAMLGDQDAVDRFLREARATVRLRGEQVARVFDVGRLDDGAPYIVMEYLEGRDLGALLRSRGRLPPTEAVDHILDAAVGVAEAHRNGIIHRDLKPGNLFLTRRPDGTPLVKVLDFGVSKMALGEAGGRGTAPSMMLGSPEYMAPEQMRSARDADERADVWAIGVILFELLSGVLPFEGESIAVVCARVLGEEPRALAEVAPDVPPALCAVVERCLRRAPDERYPHVADMAEALVPFAGDRGRAAARSIRNIVAARSATVEEARPEIASAASTLPRTTRREASGELRAGPRRLLWPGAVLAALAGAGVIVVAAIRTDGPRHEERAAPPARPPAPPVPAPVVTPLAFDAGVAQQPATPPVPTPVHPKPPGRRTVERPASVVPAAALPDAPPARIPDARDVFGGGVK